MLRLTYILIGTRDGFGLRLEEISWLSRAEAISCARRAFYFLETFNSLSKGSSALAILALYWRLFSLTRIRYAIMYLAFLSLCWVVARVSPSCTRVSLTPIRILTPCLCKTTVGAIRCLPVEAYWDASIHGECFVDESKIVYGGAISHLFLDILILILPLFELHKLCLKSWTKLGVIIVFVFGILQV